ncbi:sugar O-acetyltransferase [Stenomitos frigidus]|uniref:Acetyltransferase n=1 Tax=Stenomitos frigidus ULC18 TaxID=2107698 RepID=A0A2T1EIV1_9CYAN|nr:sugar O-acetyltransferase [Stenomitos frigidus]PSB32676.1 maltose acetyltransferase [Stenomitos frigidus ULC18]
MSDRLKTEKQKMLAGELYLANDPELRAENKRACRLLRLYNQTTETEQHRRFQTLQALFGAIGEKPQIVPPFHCDYGSNITVGDRFYMNYGGVILDCNTVHIGNDVLCAPYVQIYTAYHPTDPTVRLTGRELAAPIRIGNNVWIGGGVIICPGVTIGDNTTIGAGSVVVKDIPANVVAVGNPCRVLRAVEAPAVDQDSDASI